jgi:hypothetical protein
MTVHFESDVYSLFKLNKISHFSSTNFFLEFSNSKFHLQQSMNFINSNLHSWKRHPSNHSHFHPFTSLHNLTNPLYIRLRKLDTTFRINLQLVLNKERKIFLKTKRSFFFEPGIRVFNIMDKVLRLTFSLSFSLCTFILSFLNIMPSTTLFVIVKSEATSSRECILVLCSISYFFFTLCFLL